MTTPAERMDALYASLPSIDCHGCVPDRWLTDAESQALLREADEIGTGGRA